MGSRSAPRLETPAIAEVNRTGTDAVLTDREWTVPGFVLLSYWLRLGVEGSLVGLFVFGGRGVAQ